MSVKKVPEKLPQIGIVRFVVEAQRATEVQVGGKLGCKKDEIILTNITDYLSAVGPIPLNSGK